MTTQCYDMTRYHRQYQSYTVVSDVQTRAHKNKYVTLTHIVYSYN